MDVPTGRSEMPRYQVSKVDQQIRDVVDYWGTYSVSPPTYIHVLEIKYDILRSKPFHPVGGLFLISACPVHPYIPIMMWSDPHWVQCGCAGSMSHRCDRDGISLHVGCSSPISMCAQ